MRGKTIRVIALGGLGDLLLSTPSFKALKEKDKTRRIVVHCTTKTGMEVYKNNPYIDKVSTTSFLRNMVPYIAYHFKKIRFSSIVYGRFLPSLNYKKNATKIIAEMLGAELKDTNVQVFLTQQEEEKAKQLLNQYHNPVTLHITSLTSKNQEWPLENWEELVRQVPECTFLQLGLSKDQKVNGAVDLRGKLSFRESLAVLKQARSFVGVVSAFSHATNAFNTPGVVLFGASTPAVWGHNNNINLYKDLHCAPCIDLILNSPCPYGKPCMNLITVEEVKEALLQQLNKVTLRESVSTAASPATV